jgi:hypothetical protein
VFNQALQTLLIQAEVLVEGRDHGCDDSAKWTRQFVIQALLLAWPEE